MTSADIRALIERLENRVTWHRIANGDPVSADADAEAAKVLSLLLDVAEAAEKCYDELLRFNSQGCVYDLAEALAAYRKEND